MGVEHLYIIQFALQNVNLSGASVEKELVVGQGFHQSPSLHSMLGSPPAAPIPSDSDASQEKRGGGVREIPTSPPSKCTPTGFNNSGSGTGHGQRSQGAPRADLSSTLFILYCFSSELLLTD